MKKFKYRGKTYVWRWKGSPLHIAGIMSGMVIAVACMWLITCGAAALE